MLKTQAGRRRRSVPITVLLGVSLLSAVLCPPCLLAQQSSMQADQGNSNQAIATPSNNQTNQSSSFSTGGDLIQQNINPAIGKLGGMTVGKGGISCESASVYMQVGVYPYDNQYYAVFDDNIRDKDWMPQGAVGVSIPFGPQVASCVDAMKHQAQQVTIATEAGMLRHCLSLRASVREFLMPEEAIARSFPTLAAGCREIWGIPAASAGEPAAPAAAGGET